jgi:DNA-binding NarL/FixJ family response regulator
MSKVQIVLADRQTLFHEALQKVLEAQPDFAVVGSTDDGEELESLLACLRPDVLLFDTNLRRRSAIEALHAIASSKLPVRPILLTAKTEQSDIIRALLGGACGVLRKDSPTHLVFKSIRMVMEGDYWISRDAVCELVKNLRSLADLVERKTRLQVDGISHRQRQIIEAIAAGCSNKDIARDLRLSERTVKYHITRIFRKLGVSGRMELVRYSLKNKVIQV